jgi:hypothetical protein
MSESGTAMTWLVVAVANLPLYLWLAGRVFGNLDQFASNLRYMFIAAWSETDEQKHRGAELKFLIWLGLCVALVFLEMFLVKKVF